MRIDRAADIEAFLRGYGAQPASALADKMRISQPTLSRRLSVLGERVVRIGRARATRYALARETGRAGSRWPLYRIDAAAKPQRLGELHALQRDEFHFEPDGERPAWLRGEFANGLFPGLPWFIDDQRPQGFLGRAFARRVAADIDAPNDILRWTTDDIVLALLRHGDDAPGDLVLGEAGLQRALQRMLLPRDSVREDERSLRYPQLAEAVLRGETVGSSAGGEQPKFAIDLCDVAERILPVIVKFSERADTRAGRRWADLLICEHHAAGVLREHDYAAVQSELLQADGRWFLQSARFDRTLQGGRRGLVSLAALDAAYYGHGRIDWWRFAPALHRDGWLGAADARRLAIVGWFGALIANSDMHLGNAALHLRDRLPLSLAPVYDMLPMAFRPLPSGEIVARRYELVLPVPEFGEAWFEAALMALAFWRRVTADARISDGFRVLARDAVDQLRRVLHRL